MVQQADQCSPEILDRLPPQSLESERGVLGSLMLDPRMCDEVALIIRVEDFYANANRKLFGHLLKMHGQGSRIDGVLLLERLKQEKDLDAIGGSAYLAEVARAVPYAANAVYYAKIVREKAALRSVIHASTESLRDAYEGGNAAEVVESAERRILAVRDHHTENRVQGVSDVLQDVFTQLDALMDKRGEAAVPTGYVDFDRLLAGGLRATDLIVVAARTGVGKTALVCNIARNVAMAYEIPVLLFSLEMSSAALVERMLCSVARVDGHKLHSGFVSQEDRGHLVEASAKLSQAPLFFNDAPGQSMTEIAACCRRQKRKHGLGLVVVDYVGFVRAHNPSAPRQEQVAQIVARLKDLARELEVPIIAVAQLNRRAEDGKEPELRHLRESGALEQDADIVLLLHRPWANMSKDERSTQPHMEQQADVAVAKHRSGPTGKITLAWFDRETRFETLATEPWDMGPWTYAGQEAAVGSEF